MTARLEAAIKKLDSQELEQITALAEAMARHHDEAPAEEKLNLSWVGCLTGGPDRDGLEAQRRANELRMKLLEESMPK